jgi:hypothetical protein
VATSIFWLSITFFSKIVVVFFFGKLLFISLLPKAADKRVWPLVTGVVIYSLLVSIPYLGLLITIIVTLVGLGAIWMVLSPREHPRVEPEELPQPAGENQEMETVIES